MQLTNIHTLTGIIRLQSGLHIGSGDSEMHIGGTDSPVIKNPITSEPYIPGSSIKGKIRSLLEWRAGVVAISKGNPIGFNDLAHLNGEQKPQAESILKLFGISGGDKAGNKEDIAAREKLGPTRLSFWDCSLVEAWRDKVKTKNLMLTETKMENSINRISGTADNPRNIERVPAGAEFVFKLTIKQLDGENLLPTVLEGLKLLEMDSLGGSGSRGYGKLQFTDLKLNDTDCQSQFAAAQPFAKAA